MNFEFEIPFEDLEFTEDKDHLLGHGMTGRVYRGKYKGIHVAIKKMNSLKIENEETREGFEDVNRMNEKDFFTEAQVLLSIRHPNVVQYYGWSKAVDSRGVLCYYLVMQFCEAGDLSGRIDLIYQNQETKFSMEEKLRLTLGISRALAFMHSKDLVHRDLRPKNVLLVKVFENGQITIKALVCDFGLTRGKRDYTDISRGHPYYLAPELKTNWNTLQIPRCESDIYSLGMTIWCIFNSMLHQNRDAANDGPLFKDNYTNETMDKVMKLAKKCSTKDPNARCKVEEVVKDLEKLLENEMKGSEKKLKAKKKAKKREKRAKEFLEKREKKYRKKIVAMKVQIENVKMENARLVGRMEQKIKYMEGEKVNLQNTSREKIEKIGVDLARVKGERLVLKQHLDAITLELAEANTSSEIHSVEKGNFESVIKLMRLKVEMATEKAARMEQEKSECEVEMRAMRQSLEEAKKMSEVERPKVVEDVKSRGRFSSKRKMKKKKKKKRVSRQIENVKGMQNIYWSSFRNSLLHVLAASSLFDEQQLQREFSGNCCNQCESYSKLCALVKDVSKWKKCFLPFCEKQGLCEGRNSRVFDDEQIGEVIVGDIAVFLQNLFKKYEPDTVDHIDLLDSARCKLKITHYCSTFSCEVQPKTTLVNGMIECFSNFGNIEEQIHREISAGGRVFDCSFCVLNDGLNESGVQLVSVASFPKILFAVSRNRIESVGQTILTYREGREYELRAMVVNDQSHAWAYIKVNGMSGNDLWRKTQDSKMMKGHVTLEEINEVIKKKDVFTSLFLFVDKGGRSDTGGAIDIDMLGSTDCAQMDEHEQELKKIFGD